MKHLMLLPSILAVVICTACGGGGSDTAPNEASSLLLDQIGECFAVASGRSMPDRFNSAAERIASVPMADVCANWTAGTSIDCRAAYSQLARPYSTPGQCNIGAH